MSYIVRQAALMLSDALDEQAVETRLLRKNLDDLRFELIDLKCSLLEYDGALDGAAQNSLRLGRVLRDGASV